MALELPALDMDRLQNDTGRTGSHQSRKDAALPSCCWYAVIGLCYNGSGSSHEPAVGPVQEAATGRKCAWQSKVHKEKEEMQPIWWASGEKRKRSDSSAHKLAAQASKRLGAGEPTMFGAGFMVPDSKQVQARTVGQGGVVSGDWKDAISASDDGRSPPREREVGRGYRGERKPPGGGGGGGRDGDDPRKDRSPQRPAVPRDPKKKLGPLW